MESKLRDAVLAGIAKAQKAYWKMYGDWVENASEHWITTHVAKQLWAEFGDGSVGVEISSDDIRRRGPGRIPDLVKGRRYDIVVFNKKDEPVAVVEMKSVRQGARKSPLKDVKRVMALLGKAPDLRFGAVGYYFSSFSGEQARKSVVDKVSEYARDLKADAEELAAKHGFSVKKSRYSEPDAWEDDDGEEAWIAGCLVIERASR